MKIVVCDSAQIEARLVNWFAKQWDALEAFADPDRDPYSEFATELYGEHVDRSDKIRRHVGKQCELGLGFQMGAPKLQYSLAIGAIGPPVFLEQDKCEEAVNLYRTKHYKVKALWYELHNLIHVALIQGHEMELRDGLLHLSRERIHMPNGLDLMYPNLRVEQNEETGWVEYKYKKRNNEASKIYGGLLTENIIQCLARIIVGMQARILSHYYRIVSLSHDEIIFLAPDRQAAAAKRDALELMTTPPAWAHDLPLEAEASYAKRYAKP